MQPLAFSEHHCVGRWQHRTVCRGGRGGRMNMCVYAVALLAVVDKCGFTRQQ